jgi:hypothetical protein
MTAAPPKKTPRRRALASVAGGAAFGMFVLFVWSAVASAVFGISVQETALRAWAWVKASDEHRWIAVLTPFSVYGMARFFTDLAGTSTSPTSRRDRPFPDEEPGPDSRCS